MRNFVILALLGFCAQLVDGALGMAYGATSSTLLVGVAGLTPAIASTAVHLGEMGTTAVSGVSHWRFGNVDWGKILWLAVPGGIGAFLGAVALVSISAEAAEPLVAVFLFSLGVYVLARFSFRRNERPVVVRPIGKRFLSPLGAVAGFLDAAGGGGWGPISTPTLLSSGRMEPRRIIGTVDTSEFIVAVCAHRVLLRPELCGGPLECGRGAPGRRCLRGTDRGVCGPHPADAYPGDGRRWPHPRDEHADLLGSHRTA
jgi:uncharacterized protein